MLGVLQFRNSAIRYLRVVWIQKVICIGQLGRETPDSQLTPHNSPRLAAFTSSAVTALAWLPKLLLMYDRIVARSSSLK